MWKYQNNLYRHLSGPLFIFLGWRIIEEYPQKWVMILIGILFIAFPVFGYIKLFYEKFFKSKKEEIKSVKF